VKQIPITLRMACQRHNVDLDYMVSELNEAIAPAPAKEARPGETRGGESAEEREARQGETIGENHILGRSSRRTRRRRRFRKYYGDGCFSCPGQATESVKQSAMMHNVSEKQLLSELNRAAGSEAHRCRRAQRGVPRSGVWSEAKFASSGIAVSGRRSRT